MISISRNKFFHLLTLLYTMVLLFFAAIACFSSYHQRKEMLMAEVDATFRKLEQEYNDTLDNFWQIYMPIYESRGQSGIHRVLETYFTSSSTTQLKPLERYELSEALSAMLVRNDDVKWIALYSPQRTANYILHRPDGSLQVIPDDFPYAAPQGTFSGMEVHGLSPMKTPSGTVHTFAIRGGSLAKLTKGNILVGYHAKAFEQICQNNSNELTSLRYQITSNGEIVFDSSGNYQQTLEVAAYPTHPVIKNLDGKHMYTQSKITGNNASVLSYELSWWELFRYSHRMTLPILSVVVLFALISLVLYWAMLQIISKEVGIISSGLKTIGENHLDHRIPSDFRQSGLPEIADAINQMASRLEENINQAYYYRLRQQEAEMAELQAKFNPHFLYNSLEMLRSRCLQNGDERTADLITNLAAIFRGLIGSDNFIPLWDELTFSKRYMDLFVARYGDQVDISYDFDSDALQYGIIRNVFQPLIENYFVHGFDTAINDNYIQLKGSDRDKDTLMITMADNGRGMTDEKMQVLNEKLHEPIQMSSESYGLKNLHQRLVLFYGCGCGLTLKRNGEKGLKIEILVKKMTVEEYQKKKYVTPSNNEQ